MSGLPLWVPFFRDGGSDPEVQSLSVTFALDQCAPMTTIADIRKAVGTVSAFIALGLDGLSALGVATGFGLLVAVGRGSRASHYILSIHEASFYIALLVLPFSGISLLFGRRQLGLIALVAGIGLWLAASVLVPMADASGR